MGDSKAKIEIVLPTRVIYKRASPVEPVVRLNERPIMEMVKKHFLKCKQAGKLPL